MDICSTSFKRHEPGNSLVESHRPERLTSEAIDNNEASAANTPLSRWFHTSTSSGRKFKFRQRFADEGLESFVSSDSDGDSPSGKSLKDDASFLSGGGLSIPQPDLSLTRMGPNQRITNKKPKDLCDVRLRE